MHNLLSEAVNTYCENHSTPESEILHKINRQTHLQTELPIMLSGHLQGRILSMISHMIQPHFILEIGTFTGYSAICLAEGLPENGQLITIDINEEWKDRCEDFFQASGLANKIKMIVGNAVDIIPKLSHEFDLVFIDADKTNYELYYDLVIEKLKPNGFILADNVLFHGDVLEPKTAGKNAKAMISFNQKMMRDDRIECVLLPVRDGIMLCRKK
ncbi:MAG: class I SAM-dependent methyltransferase [Bacteroidetes bacterium]|nr:class I SAM-dependent methyltransferase [Bacteroidota bacterium]